MNMEDLTYLHLEFTKTYQKSKSESQTDTCYFRFHSRANTCCNVLLTKYDYRICEMELFHKTDNRAIDLGCPK